MIGTLDRSSAQTGFIGRSHDFAPTAPLAGDASLAARAERGLPLTPVERGQLARANDQARATAGAGTAAAGGGEVSSRTTRVKTAADFTLIGATKRDVADLNAALKYLSASPTAKALLDKLPKGAKIEIIHDGNDAYSPATKTIFWDPRSGLTSTSGQGTQSAALGFIHEVDHEVAGLRNPRPTKDGYDNTEEKRVITGSETTIAHDLHEPTRTDHSALATPVMSSSTAHTYVR